MNESRPCTWDDLPHIRELHARVARTYPEHGAMHIGELYLVLRNSPSGDPLEGVRVWPDAVGALIAAAWWDPPTESDFILAPGAPQPVTEAALVWLEEQAGIMGTPLTIVARAADAERLAMLRCRRYARTTGGNTRLRRDLSAPIAPSPLPAGFAVRHVASGDDLRARATVEASGFGNDVDQTIDRWALVSRLGNYVAELDLVAVAPDGRGASACTGWYDAASRTGEIEAVLTVPDFRRMGIGKAVISEALRRLAGLGAQNAVLYTNIGNVASHALYRSCDFAVHGEDHAWTKTIGAQTA